MKSFSSKYPGRTSVLILGAMGVALVCVMLVGINSGQDTVEAAPAPAASYSETIKTSGDETVMVSCMQGTLIATTAVFSNQFGATGGDVATANDRGCRNSASARSVGLRTTTHLYCKGSTLIAVTPIFTNQFGVTGGSVAVTANSERCR